MDDPSIEDARQELKRARAALGDAGVLIDGGGTDAGALNRLYYATFHAAQAVLYVRGVNPSSHGAVRRDFGQHVVLDGDATREDGRLLGTLYDYRQRADYGASSPDVDVEELVATVETFVDEMETLVEEHTSEDS